MRRVSHLSVFKDFGQSDIGRYIAFVTLDLSPNLKIGVTEWHFHLLGIHCLDKLTEKR